MAVYELEWQTRKKRIDPKLNGLGWTRAKPGTASISSHGRAHRTEEEETDHGPADYALWLDGRIVAIIEAKKLTVGPQNVLTQAERYARGVRGSSFDFGGLRVPFLYSTNGEEIWFHDVRHPLSRSRRIANFHTPDGLRELLERDFDAAYDTLASLPFPPLMRWYQNKANEEVGRAIAERKRAMLVAMATGTGKTKTTISGVYRLMKSGVARRVLFLVDRRALAAQTVREFAAFEVEPGLKFDKAYEVYSNKFQREDFGEEEGESQKFDPKLIPENYLTKPKPGHAFVYVSTIQRMAINILGRDAIMGLGDEAVDTDAGKLDIPIHAFDIIIADECHRGYTAAEESVWRQTLDHFDAIKIGLTATPASHTTSYFQHIAFRYSYEQAVKEGHLVDYDVVEIHTNIRMNGLFLKPGEKIEAVDPDSGATKLDQLEDERQFDTTEIERRITAPDSNRKIIEEVKKYADDHHKRYGRFPKTLIFAVNDQAHTSHANQVVTLCRDVFGRGDDFVKKITGAKDVDRPLERIREFRNRPQPGIVVTVDLLTTGVDIPDIEFLVFMRPVKSRILFEQMVGRGTRKGFHHPNKDHFTVFDCFDGTMLDYFRQTTGVTAEVPDKPTRTHAEIITDIWNNRDRDYNVSGLQKRLHRIDKQMSGEARDQFASFIPDGDVAEFARNLPAKLKTDFTATMKLLRSQPFLDLLVNYARPPRVFYRVQEAIDAVSSRWMLRDSANNEYKPEDYLTAFERFVRENPDHIEAIRILLSRPREWGYAPLKELRGKLAANTLRFTEDNLRRAHEATYKTALVDIISMIKHAANQSEPLLTPATRVERALAKVTAGQTFTPPQQAWLARIRSFLEENLCIGMDDFEEMAVFTRAGGVAAVRREFGPRIETLVIELNEALAA